VLADDYEIGQRLVERGYRVALSDCVVQTVASEQALKELVLHELRWARTIRTVRPLGFAGLFITCTTSMCLLAALALVDAGVVAPIAMIAAGLLARLLLHCHVVSRCGAPREASWLLPLRDALSLGIWAGSFVGRGVTWRGQRFSIDQDGSLVGTNSMRSS